MSDDLVDLISSVRFTPVRLREGYDMGEVDYLLDRLEAALRKGEALAPLLADVHLNEVRLREGYDIEEVDAFLGSLRSGGSATAVAAPPPHEAVPDPAVIPAVIPSVIVEQRGLLSRLFGRRR
jgi:DivIVA domain-containing protein